MNVLKQICVVTAMNLKNIPQRLGPSSVILIGMICVVGVTVSIASMSAGVMKMVNATGRPDRAVILNHGARFEGESRVPRDMALTVADAPAIRKLSDGKPAATAETWAVTLVTMRRTGASNFVLVRGIGPQALAVRPEIKLVEGRMFEPGLREAIVGRSAQVEFTGLDVGTEFSVNGTVWKIVGAFESNGGLHESSLLGDAETLLAAIRKNAWSSVLVQLESADSLAPLRDFITTNPALTLDVQRETDFFQEAVKPFNTFLLLVTYTVGVVLGLGAIFGALNTMYSAVSTRTIEIATLRAIGFGPFPVVVSVLTEGMLLAAAGGVIGAALAWLAFDGSRRSAGVVYSLAVTPGLVLASIGAALLVGLFGSLFPAIRAARLPVATALQGR